MGAKHKLNGAAFNGAMLLAALVGGLTGSWEIFLIALGLMLVSALIAKDIRR